ncbi:LysR family transcriptional regulator [Bradyrhizobium sp. U87765 SZCCT0131]|uniref:LysR family transcriptional regulator n=1 Tax=unclassified Bradyrhizobium TaxID=2631580 RepID=UPI001BACE75F|nr:MULTISPECIES: LysR family transcriptional regulator [unclassified Bradyrhizobium]MBR1218479.1 LysR family transcriptional regulator [Bradyrhizobium sp. U87765 SZCCT0131]MBR1260575.1 LysR family transcriptional regulator [Bradyrhizobium sp. U87765 SZCCT0134]MBR1303977.1 LysR family transcriptional regulator [Bradyrhizobium sp. U87765 SZCCT0110]MBR1319583.1 LysR family transcriptional regulator [Bradyrhizobium sp. U87765 SZCCT0109]MBR1347908.1 LysR family transcriptional regulator [Bradyrhizo
MKKSPPPFDPKPPTLDQLQIFLAIVEAGSFAGAARRLRRATSVVSYAITNLEAQLGLTLFDRASTKTPQLTEAGRAVLADARTIALGVGDLLARARGLIWGLEAEVALVVDVMLPMAKLAVALDAFQSAFPTVTLRLHVEALGAITQLVLNGTASVGIGGPLLANVDGLATQQIGAVRLIPVAAPSHPLSAQGATLASAARKSVQLVLTDRSELTKGQEFGVVAVRTWRLADLGAKHALLLAGVGWGSMPEPMVRDDLAAGRLVRLNLDNWENGAYPLQAVHRTDKPPGPAARWLMSQLRDVLSTD